MTTAASYASLVQELYIAYFGRPADYVGLQNFEAALTAANAPNDPAALAAAYSTNPAIKGLIDSFGTSNESAALYGNGSTATFVNAIFEDLFGRPAADGGMSFWANAIDSGQISRGDAALAILAGAEPSDNSSQQATADWALTQARVAVATSFTTDLGSSPGQIADYAGATAAQQARLMLAGVTATSGSIVLGSTGQVITTAGGTTSGNDTITANSASNFKVLAGNGTNVISDTAAGATIAITTGTGINTITLGNNTTGTINLGAHAATVVDAITIGVSGTSLTAIEKISGMNNAGADTLTFAGDASVLTFKQVAASSVVATGGDTTLLADWVAAADGLGGVVVGNAHSVTWFVFQGNTYLLESVAGQAADAGSMATGNTLVELVGQGYTFSHATATSAAGGVVHLIG